MRYRCALFVLLALILVACDDSSAEVEDINSLPEVDSMMVDSDMVVDQNDVSEVDAENGPDFRDLIDDLGEPGWRGSTEPWEPNFDESDDVDFGSFDIWSDDEAVYLARAWHIPPDQDPDGFAFWQIDANRGDGWTTLYSPDGTLPDQIPARLTGIPESETLFGWGEGGGVPGQVTEIQDGQPVLPDFLAYDIAAVDSTLAYAVAEDQRKVLERREGVWEPLTAVSPYNIQRLWASSNRVFGVGTTGTIATWDGTDWELHDSGTVEDLTTVFGLADDDVWVGTNSGTLLQYDGDTWTERAWPMNADAPSAAIEGMWGAEGVLYFHTDTQLVRWDGAAFETIGDWPFDRSGDLLKGGLLIHSIWGNSPNELFILLSDIVDGEYRSHVLWYDGVEFHEM